MKDRIRLALLLVLVVAGVGLIQQLGARRIGTPLGSSLAPAFEVAGTPLKSLNHLLTKVTPIDDLDEAEFGEVYRARYAAQLPATDPDLVYLDDLMAHIRPAARKPFGYRAFPIDGDEPNAMALPGGVILVTRGLLRNLGSEAELVSVLGHEMGHVEQGHCVDAVRFELLARKLGARPLGEIADFGVRILTAHSFSKNQEHEADQYGYTLLVNSPFDPLGTGKAFLSMLQYQRRLESGSAPRGADPFRDYFASHPPLELREAEYRARATAWWSAHPDQTRRLGRQNLRDRVSTWTRPATDDVGGTLHPAVP